MKRFSSRKRKSKLQCHCHITIVISTNIVTSITNKIIAMIPSLSVYDFYC